MKAQEREAQHAESQMKAESGPTRRYEFGDYYQQGLQSEVKQVDSLNALQSLWQSSAQVVAFRKSASTIADEYLQQNGVKLSRSKSKSTGIGDAAAYAQGERDSREIDVRQGRISG